MFSAHLPVAVSVASGTVTFTGTYNTAATVYYNQTANTSAAKSFSLTCSATGGTAPYTYKLYSNGVFVQNLASGANTVATTKFMQGAITVQVTDSASHVIMSSTLKTIKTYYLEGAPYASPDSGAAGTFSSTLYANNTAINFTPFSYQWYYADPPAYTLHTWDTTKNATTGTFVVAGPWFFDLTIYDPFAVAYWSTNTGITYASGVTVYVT